MNDTIILAIKKHAEKDPLDWDLWVPYVLLAYRTRIHSTTLFTPYELMFGRSMNGFEDYRQISDKQLIEIRSSELKELIENKQELARETIEKKQENQKAIQNRRNKVDTTTLPIGTKVAIKVLKIQGKIRPDFIGIHTIDGQTQHGNYFLRNNKGERLKIAYPRDRLKVVDPAVEAMPDVPQTEKIIDAKFNHGAWEYLVKWPESQKKMDTWVLENDFVSNEHIEAYWNEGHSSNDPPLVTSSHVNTVIEEYRPIEPSLKGKVLIKTTKVSSASRGNLPTTKTHPTPRRKSAERIGSQLTNQWSSLLVALIFINLLRSTRAFKVAEKFKYCETHQNPAIWDLPDSCVIQPKLEAAETADYFILSQKTQPVSGNGWFCAKKKYQVRTYENLLKYTSREVDEEVMDITVEDCNMMVFTKRCGEAKMTCTGDYCELPFKPNFEYSWLTTVNKTVYSCTMYPLTLNADTAISTMIISTTVARHCQAKDGFCLLNQGIVTWSMEIIKECPFNYVQRRNLMHLGNALINDAQSKYFQLIEETIICNNMSAYRTTEGFYLTRDPRASQLSITDANIKTIDGLILSEMDYQSNENIKLMATLTKITNQKICQLYKSFINIYSKLDDEFFTFTDINGNEATLYSDMSRVFIPNCIEVNDIEVLEKTNRCYKDFAVIFKNKNETISAFLTNDRILRATSKEVTCKNHHQLIHLKSSHRIIKMAGTVVTIGPDERYIHLKVNILNANISKINYHHDAAIIQGIDIIKQVANVTKVIEGKGEFHVMENYESETKQNVNALVNDLGKDLLKVGIVLTTVAYSLFNPITLFGIALLICACRYTRAFPKRNI